MFARVDDRAQQAYPGLALVVISGARPVALHRVNYFEDGYFARQFDPHPDYGLPCCWKDVSVSVAGLTPYDKFLSVAGMAESQITGWLATEGQLVSAGEPVVSLSLQVNGHTVNVRSPRTGMITKLPEVSPGKRFTWLFAVRYRETEEPESYPFLEPFVFVGAIRDSARSKAAKATRSLWIISALGLLSVIGLIVTHKPAFLTVIVLAAFAGFRKAAEAVRCKQVLAAAEMLTIDRVLNEWHKLNAPGEPVVLEEPRPPVDASPPVLPAAPAPSAPADAPAALDLAPQENSGAGAAVPPVSQPESRPDDNARPDGVEAAEAHASAGPRLESMHAEPAPAALTADHPVPDTGASSATGAVPVPEPGPSDTPRTPTLSDPPQPLHATEKRGRPATMLVIIAAVAVLLIIVSVIAVIKNKTHEAEQAAAAQQAAQRAAAQAADRAAKEAERSQRLEALLNKQRESPAAPEKAGVNAPETNSKVPAMANPPSSPSSPAPSSRSTVPPIDPNDDPIGPGGFITPSAALPGQTTMVKKEALLCVPLRVDYYGFGNPSPDEKMKAFRNAVSKMIRDDARRAGVNDKTQFRVADAFDSFDPANPDAHHLVTVLDIVSGANTCPNDSMGYTLTVESKP